MNIIATAVMQAKGGVVLCSAQLYDTVGMNQFIVVVNALLAYLDLECHVLKHEVIPRQYLQPRERVFHQDRVLQRAMSKPPLLHVRLHRPEQGQ